MMAPPRAGVETPTGGGSQHGTTKMVVNGIPPRSKRKADPQKDPRPEQDREKRSTGADTGGKGTWKPVITYWVHLELMCIFPTM